MRRILVFNKKAQALEVLTENALVPSVRIVRVETLAGTYRLVSGSQIDSLAGARELPALLSDRVGSQANEPCLELTDLQFETIFFPKGNGMRSAKLTGNVWDFAAFEADDLSKPEALETRLLRAYSAQGGVFKFGLLDYVEKNRRGLSPVVKRVVRGFLPSFDDGDGSNPKPG